MRCFRRLFGGPWIGFAALLVPLAVLGKDPAPRGVLLGQNPGNVPPPPKLTMQSPFEKRVPPAVVRLNAGPGLSLSNGASAFGVNVGAVYRITDGPIYAGIDLGMYRWTSNVAGYSSSMEANVTAFQLLPTVYGRFKISRLPGVTPYMGASIGPTVYVSNLRFTTYSSGREDSTNRSTSSPEIEILVRPGVDFELGKNLLVALEPKFGMVRSFFIFKPQIAFIFSY